MNRVFILADLQNAYVSMECVFRPDLDKRPVVVLSNNDGCAIARSEEAKQLGIRMGQPYYQWRALEKKYGIAVFSANFSLYGDMSDRFIKVLRDFSPDTEPYSIDEVFQEWTSLKRIDYQEYALIVRQRILQWLGLPARVSIASTKTLAKLGQIVLKEKLHPKGQNGVFNFLALSTPELEKLLSYIPIHDVWGVGRQLAPQLEHIGIHTALDLRNASVHDIKKRFSVVLAKTVQELQGTPCIELETFPEDKQQICCSRSFGQPLFTLEEIASALAHHVALATEKLRKQDSIASGITVFLKTGKYRETSQYENSTQLSFPAGASDTLTIYKIALRGLERIYRKGYAYAKSGVILWGISPLCYEQQSLFAPPASDDQSSQLMKTIDRLNQTMGKGTIKLASEIASHKWKAQQQHLSQRYTTRWSELLCVRS